jgi:hypothetical protein
MKYFQSIFFISVCVLILSNCKNDQDSIKIRQLIGETFDQPDSKVAVDPLIVKGNYAIADWRQGDKAGRSLIIAEHGHWRISLCGGKGLKDTNELKSAGVPSETADQLVKELTAAEASLEPDAIRRFDEFGPTLDMSGRNTNHSHH